MLDSFIMTFTRPELRQAEYYHCGNKVAIYRKAQLSQKLSEICETVFNRTPRINNETLNKNDLPTNTINSRTKVVRGLLQSELSPMLGLVGTGQDVSIMRSALIVPGVVDDIKSSPSIHISDCPDERLANVLQHIDQFFANSGLDQSGSNFSALYDELTRPELGIGMKRGPIPLYVAAVLHSYKDHLTISSYGQELEINAELLNSINAKPEAYTARLIDWSQEKADYIKNLENLFSQHIIAREKNVNSFLYIVRAMQRWYIALPKYAKEARELYVGGEQFHAIEKQNIRFANALKAPSINPHEFLFESLPKVFGFDGFIVETSACIERAKELYDKALDNLTDVQKMCQLSLRRILLRGKRHLLQRLAGTKSSLRKRKSMSLMVLRLSCSHSFLKQVMTIRVLLSVLRNLLQVCGLRTGTVKLLKYSERRLQI